jgi:hypothetical protein
MKRSDDLSVTVLPNPVQADTLVSMLRLTPPRQRICVAAAYLGVALGDIFSASGMTPSDRGYYANARSDDKSLPSAVMVRLARVLDVPFAVLWDEEALEAPVEVLRGFSYRKAGEKSDGKKSRRRNIDGAGPRLRLASG